MKYQASQNLYKIWDITNKCYVHGNKKSTWKSKIWADAKIESLTKLSPGYYYHTGHRFKGEFELHEFEMSFKKIIEI